MFHELSTAAQDKAEQLLEAEAWEDMDSDSITEEINGELVYLATGDGEGCVSRRELAERFGLRVYWQVSYGQSDHAHLDGVITCGDWPAFGWPEQVTQISVNSSRYGCTITSIYAKDENGDEWREDNGQLYEECGERLQDLCNKLYLFARMACENYVNLEGCLARIECAGPRRFLADGSYAPIEYWEER